MQKVVPGGGDSMAACRSLPGPRATPVQGATGRAAAAEGASGGAGCGASADDERAGDGDPGAPGVVAWEGAGAAEPEPVALAALWRGGGGGGVPPMAPPRDRLP